jgi:signal transduction histidine kinase
VIANLVDNALECGAAPVVVELGGSDAGVVEFTVTDHGPGVPKELIPVLFFGVRAPRGPERRGGVGQGLALAKGLMEAMGGRIAYEVAPDGGARFRLVVPMPNRRRGGPARL